MIVVFTREAENDLERIGDYIAVDNPQRAVTFVNELINRCERLADAPHGFPLVPRYEGRRIRRRSYREYLIFYRVGVAQIEIVHVLNGAQDYEAILFPKPEQG